MASRRAKRPATGVPRRSGVYAAAAVECVSRAALERRAVTCGWEVKCVRLEGRMVRANVPVYLQERAMSTSPLYESIRAALQQHLPSVIDSQSASLGLAIVGAVESMSSQM